MDRSILDGDFGVPSAPFPSMESTIRKDTLKKRNRDINDEPLHFLATSATALSYELSGNVSRESEQPEKTENSVEQRVVEPVAKRPVGRPRLHPKKVLDPNRIRRGESESILLAMYTSLPCSMI